MRPPNVIFIALLAVFALGVAMLVPQIFHAEKPGDAPAREAAMPPTNEPKKPSIESVIKPVVLPPTNSFAAASPVKSPSQTVDELQALAMNDDMESLELILAELTNSDAEIRVAAREAAVQFGDRVAAPALRAAAAQVESPQEKAALLEAADFLELPSLEVHSVTNPHPSRLSTPVGFTNGSGVK